MFNFGGFFIEKDMGYVIGMVLNVYGFVIGYYWGGYDFWNLMVNIYVGDEFRFLVFGGEF